MVAAAGLLEGFHKHHIIPRHLGGTDSPENIVLLHPYDHAIIHYVRWKIYRTDGDAWAFNKLKRWLDKGGLTVRGMKHSEEAKQKIGTKSFLRIRKPHSEETKAKISEKKLGKPSNRKGATHSVESIQKMIDSRKGQIVWNKGKKGSQIAWNKGLVGAQIAWNKGKKGLIKWSDEAKALQSQRVKQMWIKRKQESMCKPQQ